MIYLLSGCYSAADIDEQPNLVHETVRALRAIDDQITMMPNDHRKAAALEAFQQVVQECLRTNDFSRYLAEHIEALNEAYVKIQQAYEEFKHTTKPTLEIRVSKTQIFLGLSNAFNEL